MSVRQTLLSLIVCKDNVFSPNYIINMCFFTFSTKIQIDLSHGGMHDWWRVQLV